ncbi:MAG: hypothetical protein H0X33_07705 [Taibaiella sp.]|nr:hypothetical protein [Taibaiella sp.]
MRSYLFPCFFLLLITGKALAQKQFTEGTIVYDVSIEAKAGKAMERYYGIYTINIKDKEMRQELKLNKGYDDVLVYNGNDNSVYSLKITPDKKYAIQLNNADLAKKNRVYENYDLDDVAGDSTINGLPGERAKITYKDGSKGTVIYTRKWLLTNPRIYERFPGIKHLPLAFTYTNADGTTLSFTLVKILDAPIENSLFRIPADYKIMTNAEYKEMNR